VLVACLGLADPSGGWAQEARADEGTADPESASDPNFARLANPAFPVGEVRAVAIDRGPKVERADLAPYFSEGKLAEAKAAFDAGKYTRARELLEGAPDTSAVKFLRALSAFRALDFAFASKEFEALADAWRPLRDRCLVHSGQAFEQLHDWASAVRVYGLVSPTSRMVPDARFGLARALRFLKNPTAALERLKDDVERPAPPWGRDLGAEALLVQADILAGKSDAKGERAALVKLWSRHPLSPQALKTEARLGDTADVGNEALVTRGEVLIDAHHNAEGEALIAPLLETLKLPDALACRAHFAVGKAQRKQRQHAKAVATLAPVTKKCRDRELRAKALFTLGFSQTFAVPALAATTYETLARDYPDHALADDALFFAADGRLRRGERDEGVDRLLQLADGYPTSDNTADGLFRLFWLYRAEGNAEAGLQFLEEIEGRFAASEETYELERARYWRGRVAEAAGRTDEALGLFEALSREHPATYYGLIGRERVEALDPARGDALRAEVAAAQAADDPFPIYAGALGNDPQFLSAVELLRLGLGELVPTEILAVDRTGLPTDSIRLMVLVLSLAKEERAAHGLARIWLRHDLTGPITAERRAIWEIAYPLAFRESVVGRSRDADELDPDLLQALMREESALDQRALSWAGALGLCQLMPSTAAQVAAQLKLKHPTQAALLEADLNITLGGRYLADLLIRAKGIKQFALAGYNAGEGSVARWRRDNGDADLAEWVEQIPVQETRGYVKRVLRSYNTYKLLYAPADVARTVAPPPKPAPKPAIPARKTG
jgi:soluble lytic murein transglycosylase